MSVGLTQAMVSLPCFYGFNQFAVWPVPQSVSKIISNHSINVGFPLSQNIFQINSKGSSIFVNFDTTIINCSYFVRQQAVMV